LNRQAEDKGGKTKSASGNMPSKVPSHQNGQHGIEDKNKKDRQYG
jgi:hypothetical protein